MLEDVSLVILCEFETNRQSTVTQCRLLFSLRSGCSLSTNAFRLNVLARLIVFQL
jgi:hypothetical protein